jgi:hypothetical protein
MLVTSGAFIACAGVTVTRSPAEHAPPPAAEAEG